MEETFIRMVLYGPIVKNKDFFRNYLELFLKYVVQSQAVVLLQMFAYLVDKSKTNKMLTYTVN